MEAFKAVAIWFCLLSTKSTLAEFVIKEMKMTDENFEICNYCDERSDRLGSNMVAEVLRDFMKTDHVKIVVDKGDVLVRQSYPNEKIETGHSCSVTAEAQNVVGTASMIPNTTSLGPDGIFYDEISRNAFAVSEVMHALTVDLDVKVRFGSKIAGHCHHIKDEKCHTDGYTEGTNRLSVNLHAANVMPMCVDGQQHLSFNVDAHVFSEVKHEKYGPIQVGKKHDCKIEILHIPIATINSRVQKYAQRYLNNDDRFTELRTDKLVAELESKLGTHLGSEVLIKLTNPDGTPRLCSNLSLKSCVRKKCPEGFERIAESDMCQRFFGPNKPDCSQFGPDATLYERSISGSTMYWCHTPRIVA